MLMTVVNWIPMWILICPCNGVQCISSSDDVPLSSDEETCLPDSASDADKLQSLKAELAEWIVEANVSLEDSNNILALWRKYGWTCRKMYGPCFTRRDK